MSETSWADPAIWTSTTAAATAAGVVLSVALAWVFWRRWKAVREQHRTAHRRTRMVSQFQSASPLRVAMTELEQERDPTARAAIIEKLKAEARGSAKSYWAVMEVMTSHLRRHARSPLGASPAKGAGTDAKTLAPDIQGIVSFLLHRDTRHEEQGAGLDLRSTDLSHADMRGIYLRYADFRGAALYGTALRGANLRDCDFQDADLRDADLRDSDLRGAKMKGALLRGAQFSNAKLYRADFRETDISEANFGSADLNAALMPEPSPDTEARSATQ